MYRRAYALLIGVTALMGGLTVAVSLQTGRAMVDPEGFLGPAWVRLPVMVLAAAALDLVPRALWYGRGKDRSVVEVFRARVKEHWTRERFSMVALGIVCFYLVYVCYRNLKNMMPFVLGHEEGGLQTATSYDRELHLADKAIFFGHDPAVVIHNILGDNAFTAQILSINYMTFIPMVAVLVAVWLVWSRNISYGYWFVTSQALIWTLGTLTYYMLPTLGPGIEYPAAYAHLPHTAVTDLMDGLVRGRQSALYISDDAMNSVAGFASLHTGVSLLWALMAQYTVRSRIIRIVFWVNFAITVTATLYFGWHYIADDIAGVMIALVSFYLGAKATGQVFDRRGSHPTTTTSKVPVDGEKMGAEERDADGRERVDGKTATI